MARKKANGHDETPVESVTREFPTEKVLTGLLTKCRSNSKKVGTMNGELREEIAYAVDNKHLHAKAFRAVRAQDKMEPEELQDYFAHRDQYEEATGQRARAAAAPPLPMDDKVVPIGKRTDLEVG